MTLDEAIAELTRFKDLLGGDAPLRTPNAEPVASFSLCGDCQLYVSALPQPAGWKRFLVPADQVEIERFEREGFEGRASAERYAFHETVRQAHELYEAAGRPS
jgi:hypothetical protein